MKQYTLRAEIVTITPAADHPSREAAVAVLENILTRATFGSTTPLPGEFVTVKITSEDEVDENTFTDVGR